MRVCGCVCVCDGFARMPCCLNRNWSRSGKTAFHTRATRSLCVRSAADQSIVYFSSKQQPKWAKFAVLYYCEIIWHSNHAGHRDDVAGAPLLASKPWSASQNRRCVLMAAARVIDVLGLHLSLCAPVRRFIVCPRESALFHLFAVMFSYALYSRWFRSCVRRYSSWLAKPQMHWRSKRIQSSFLKYAFSTVPIKSCGQQEKRYTKHWLRWNGPAR